MSRTYRKAPTEAEQAFIARIEGGEVRYPGLTVLSCRSLAVSSFLSCVYYVLLPSPCNTLTLATNVALASLLLSALTLRTIPSMTYFAHFPFPELPLLPSACPC
jgi:hypothetical protein